jgi:hypothetical protein
MRRLSSVAVALVGSLALLSASRVSRAAEAKKAGTDAAANVLRSPTGTTLTVANVQMLKGEGVGHYTLVADVEFTNGGNQSFYPLFGIGAQQPGIIINGPRGPVGLSPDGSLECSHEEVVVYETFYIWFGEDCVEICELPAPGGTAGPGILPPSTDSSRVNVILTRNVSRISKAGKPPGDFAVRFVVSNNVARVATALHRNASAVSSVGPTFAPRASWKYELRLPVYIDAAGRSPRDEIKRLLDIAFTLADDVSHESRVALRCTLSGVASNLAVACNSARPSQSAQPLFQPRR